MDVKEVQEEVKEAVEAASAPTEKVPSPEVKVDPVSAPAAVEDEKVSKMQEQINNLNIALKKEREDGKATMADLTSKLEDATSLTDRLKQAINPEEPDEIIPTYATKEQVEEALEAKLRELKEESSNNQKIEAYKVQIKDLETKWNGKDGKPIYKDDEVLKWQQENDKNYLSPEDAFYQMKHSEIVDYEVKQKLAGKPSVEDVERSAKIPSEHVAPDIEENAKLDTRAAVLEAMEAADKEM